MAEVGDLKDAISESLQKKGVLNRLKAQIRAEMFSILDEFSNEKPPICNENLIINELIQEYLEYNKYKHTASVFTAESGQSEMRLKRPFLENELNVLINKETNSVIPGIVGVTFKDSCRVRFMAASQKIGVYFWPDKEDLQNAFALFFGQQFSATRTRQQKLT